MIQFRRTNSSFNSLLGPGQPGIKYTNSGAELWVGNSSGTKDIKLCPTITSSSIVDTGLKLIQVGKIYKQGIPYYGDPPPEEIIQGDAAVTFNHPAFLYDEDTEQYSLKHSQYSFIGINHLKWDDSMNLFKLTPALTTSYMVKVVELQCFLSGVFVPTISNVLGGIWYRTSSAFNPSGIQIEPSGATVLDGKYLAQPEHKYYASSHYSETHIISQVPLSGLYYPTISFSTYNNCKFIPCMGGTSCVLIIKVYASQTSLIE